MCGINGFNFPDNKLIHKMKKFTANRGPDAEGIYIDEFNTTSDTEVILHLFDKFNTEAFKKLSGIFSICIWDKINKKLYLVRDTLGVKPLYYYFDNKNKNFFFLLQLDQY